MEHVSRYKWRKKNVIKKRFSKSKILNDRSAQALYTHLILSSDDDGSGRGLSQSRRMIRLGRLTGLLIVKKKFILPLNDDMVSITDFEEQNKNPEQTEYNPHIPQPITGKQAAVDGKRVTGQKNILTDK